MNEERRIHPRYDIMAQIRVKRGRVNYIMAVKDVSRSGMFVTVNNIHQMPWFRIGQKVELDIFSISELDNIRVNGRIVRVISEKEAEKQGFAVEFTELSDENKAKLEQLINLATSHAVPPPLPQKSAEK